MRPQNPVVVIGGVNHDIIATASERTKKRDSTPGHVRLSHGGVARNVVENLGRLGVPTRFISVLGSDQPGQAIRQTLTSIGVKVISPPSEKTSSYVAIHDDDGDMLFAINDMEAMERLDINVINAHKKAIQNAPFVVLDTNVTETVIDVVTALTPHAIVDAVSTVKAKRLTDYLNRIDTLKLNNHEAAALVNEKVENINDAKRAANKLIDQGVKKVYLTMGAHGVVYADATRCLHHNAPAVDVARANGAGDAFTAGIAYARFHTLDELTIAFEMARLTLRVDAAVHPTINVDMDAFLKQNHHYDEKNIKNP